MSGADSEVRLSLVSGETQGLHLSVHPQFHI